jgi:acyl dehydratase
MDPAIVDRTFAPVGPYVVSAAKVAEFATATQWRGAGVPPTFPILLLNDAMLAFLADVGASLERIVHGEQRFAYQRPIVVGDELTATLRVASLRSLGGADVIGTVSTITDASGQVVCEAKATLVHSGATEEGAA